jgi:hypothetical protein
MKKRITAGLIAFAALGSAGCEGGNAFKTAGGRAEAIKVAAEAICGDSADSPRKGVINIMLMEGAADDGIVTCGDGTNRYFDG